MNGSFSCMSFEAVSSVPARFSFSQLLLILCYALLQSTLPVQLGDHRPIQDILRRRDRDWEPRIGSEGVLELQQQDWHRTKPETRRIWHEIREWLAQKDPVVLTVSAEHVRNELGFLLHRIEQISAQCLNTLHRPGPRLHSSDTFFGSKVRLILIGFSLAVTPMTCSNIPLTSTLWDPDQNTLSVMLSQLNESSLFPNRISSHDLLSALNSLEMIFVSEQANSSSKIEVVRYETIEWSHGNFELQDRRQKDDLEIEQCKETMKYRGPASPKRRKYGFLEPMEVGEVKRRRVYK
ncbi:hypothetical protein N7478_010128 [Penicillium angulare]|uniref:uncharacterized protein n=1 Tax=Penicillium angulare TaxID=116970 RepID=UPI00254056FA|nr:uncharacterized protein N7478_010128 [Penicillium angulare]KAJ5267320.1 hypothetical protein N7478_010128 [Penicillium angulare]